MKKWISLEKNEKDEFEKALKYITYNNVNKKIIEMFFCFDSNHIYEQQKLAIKDWLTWVFNRRFYDNYFMNIVKRIKAKIKSEKMRKSDFSNKKRFHIIMDIDHFKKFNDIYWHQLWDNVLKHISNLISKNIRDDFFRYWWEEFTIITDEISEKDLISFIENKIVNLIRENPYIENGKTYPITLSIWVSEIDKHVEKEGLNNEEVIRQIIEESDKAMYEVKQNWRNWYKLAS